MADTTFLDFLTPIQASWLNDVNDLTYKEIISPERYGAIGDGTTDDTIAWQNAINAMATAGGGVVRGVAGSVYKITNTLNIKTGVQIDLGGSQIVQHTTNTPIFAPVASTICTHWSIRNGTLKFNTQQTSSNTLGVGIRLANGAFSYDFIISNLIVDQACDGILNGTSAGTFAFVGKIENFIGLRCAAYAINIACDSAAGANTNLVFTNCWALQLAGSEISTSKGFYFKACSQSQWNSLFADHVQNEFCYFESCSGSWGVLTAESCDWIRSSGVLSAVTFADCFGNIQSLQFLLNTITTSATGEIYLVRPTTSSGTFRMNIENWRSSNNIYTGSAIYEVNPSANMIVLNGYASLDRTAQFANHASIEQWNGGYLTGSATYDPASLADGAGATTTVTVTGAALGDFAMASFSLDLQGITLTAWVSATNTVSVRFKNETGGVIDLASGTLKAIVLKR